MEELTRLKDDCEKVVSMMHSKRQNIFNRLEILDKEAGARDQRRKEVMLREMKRVLALLTETEKNLVTEFKAEVMDKMALVSRLSETFRKLRDDISIAVMKEKTENVLKLNEDLETLKKQFDEVDLDFLEKCLDIQLNVHCSPVDFEALRSQYRNLIFHSAGSLSPKNILFDKVSVVGTGGQDRIQFSIFHVDRAALSQDFILKKLMVTVSSKASDGTRMVHEEESVFDKIRKHEGNLVLESPSQSPVGQVLVTVRLQKCPVEISVKLFDCNILGSPRSPSLHLPEDSAGPVASDQSLAVFNNTIIDNRTPGYEDLDESELKSLDTTGIRLQNYLDASHRKTPRLTKMSPLTELVEETGDSSNADVASSRPRLQKAAPKSILRQQTLMDPPDSPSSSPFNPKFKGTMKGPLPSSAEIGAAILKLSEGTCEAQDSGVIDISLNKSMRSMPIVVEEDDDPHLGLNESKAPSPTSLRKTIIEDSCWGEEEEEGRDEEDQPTTADLNVSILPGMGNFSDQSLWEEQEIIRFNFGLGCLEEVGKIEPEVIGVTSSRGGQKTLECPDSLALLSGHGLVLVSEPERNRIGVYNANTFKFAAWFQYPSNEFQKMKRSFVKPTSLLVTGDILVITDSEEMMVFSISGLTCTLVFSKLGCFHGLTSSSEEEGKFFTISKEEKKTFLLTFEKSNNKGLTWKICSKIPVHEDHPASTTNIRFLIEKDNKIYLTNQASHHLIQVDLKSGEQKVGGYRGHNFGQIYQPADLLSDDASNLLLCDGGNNRLLVFNEKMQFIKEMTTPYLQPPHSMLRQGKFVFVVYRGHDNLQPVIVKFKLSVAGLESEETTPSCSDRE